MITTRPHLAAVFRQLGMAPGMDVMVHSAMSSLGFVLNGPLDVIDALRDVVGDEGTILMPAHSGQLTDPAGWKRPSLSPDDVDMARRLIKPFDKRTTPIRNRGVIPATFLTYPGVLRSNHPLNSVIAQGPKADWYTSTHPLHASEGIDSPIGRLYHASGYALLLGVSLIRCTAIHLAEFLADVPYLKNNQLRVLTTGPFGDNEFVRLTQYPNDSDTFDRIRQDFPHPEIFREAASGDGLITLFPLRPVVDFVVATLRHNPNYFSGANV